MVNAIQRQRRSRWMLLGPPALLGLLTLVLCLASPSRAAAACGNEALREEQGTTALPDCRAYEMVSPSEKGFVNIDAAILDQFKFTVGEGGNAISYCNAGAGGAQITLRCGAYVTRRVEGTGWRTRIIAPLACALDLEAHEFTAGGQQLAFISSDLSSTVIQQPEAATCGVPPLDSSAPLPGVNLYRASLTTSSPMYELLTHGLSSATDRSFNTRNGIFAGGSKDFSHVVMRSTGDECEPACNEFSIDGTGRIFDWTEGEAHLVSRGPDNFPLTGNTAVASTDSNGAGTGVGAVSADGSRIYFANPSDQQTGCESAGCELYLRKDDRRTAWVSEQECTPACANDAAADEFMWANPSGDRALFASGAQLVNADTSPATAACPQFGQPLPLGCDLYEYRDGPDPASEPNNLVDLTLDREPSDGTSGSLEGVLGMSDDGNTVYFVAASQLVSGASTQSGIKIYRWTWNDGSPEVQYLGVGGEGVNYDNGNNLRTTVVRVDPAGRHLLLETKTAMNPAVDTDGNRDIYRWGEGEGWLCLSCQDPGEPSMGNAQLQLSQNTSVSGLLQNGDLERVASDDMERVFFMTPEALVPQDVNGETSCPKLEEFISLTLYSCQDLYEWHDGMVRLISTGAADAPVQLVGTTPTADDVFFTTDESLVGWDPDEMIDFYDARVGGGFPEPVPPPAPCEAEACRRGGTVPPGGPGAATSAFEGAFSPKPAPTRCRNGYRRVKVKGRFICKKAAKHKRHRRHHKPHNSRKGR